MGFLDNKKITFPSYNHKFTKRDVMSFHEMAQATSSNVISLLKKENGEYQCESHKLMAISNEHALLSYEELVNIMNNIQTLDNEDKIQITQTNTSIGVATTLTTKLIDNYDVTDYSNW